MIHNFPMKKEVAKMSNKEQKSKVFATFMKLLKYLKKYQFHFWCSILFTAISVILSLYIPILVGQAIDEAVGVGAVDFEKIKAILLTKILMLNFL